MVPPVHLHVSPGDDAPLYRQLARQVAEGIATGSLLPGERLESLRELAKKLVVAPLTVKKAYDELESQGLIETRQGRGTFVRADAARSKQGAAERLRPLVRRLLVDADLGGVEAGALAALIEAERATLREERRNQEDATRAASIPETKS